MRTISMGTRAERWISSTEACMRLGVKRASLYTYVSRGLIRCAGEGRTRRYHGDDVERVAKRSAARRGHAAVASGALHWGDAVLDSAITRVDEGGFAYRGRDVASLIEERVPFEAVADLLWGALREAWPEHEPPTLHIDRSLGVTERLVDVANTLARTEGGGVSPDAAEERARARRLIRAMANVVGDHGDVVSGSVASIVASRWGVDASKVWLLDAALVVVADHELNVSSFTARVVASSGADLWGCIVAALQAMKGPLHGGVAERIEALLDGVEAHDLDTVLRKRFEAGEPVPGFGHKLYPRGDPRYAMLLGALRDAGVLDASSACVRHYTTTGAAVLGEAPTLDLGLLTLAHALALPRGAAGALFALGRVAGWVAHIFEQRAIGGLIRPRARYVGS